MSEAVKLAAMIEAYREMQVLHLREQQEINEHLRSLLALHMGPRSTTLPGDVAGPMPAGEGDY